MRLRVWARVGVRLVALSETLKSIYTFVGYLPGEMFRGKGEGELRIRDMVWVEVHTG